jgi:uncharacterized protein (DUF2267 family)
MNKMSSTGLPVFDETIQKTNTWLKDISQKLGSDRHRAYQALRAVLHCLRDRLTMDEAAQLGDQLPMLVRDITRPGIRLESRRKSARARSSLRA